MKCENSKYLYRNRNYAVYVKDSYIKTSYASKRIHSWQCSLYAILMICQHNKYFRYKLSKCCYLHYLYLIVAICFVHVLGHLQAVLLNTSHVIEIF
jgi:hypothetical protein